MFNKKEQPLANSINTEYTSKYESNASKSNNSSFDGERLKEKEEDYTVWMTLAMLGVSIAAVGGY